MGKPARLFLLSFIPFLLLASVSLAAAQTYVFEAKKSSALLTETITFQFSTSVPSGYLYVLQYRLQGQTGETSWKPFSSTSTVSSTRVFSIKPSTNANIKDGIYEFRVLVGATSPTSPTNVVKITLTDPNKCVRSAPKVDPVSPADGVSKENYDSDEPKGSILVQKDYQLKVTNTDTAGCGSSYFQFKFGAPTQGVTLKGDPFVSKGTATFKQEGYLEVGAGNKFAVVTGRIDARVSSLRNGKIFEIPIVVSRNFDALPTPPKDTTNPSKTMPVKIQTLLNKICVDFLNGISLRPELILEPESGSTKIESIAGTAVVFKVTVKNNEISCPDDRFQLPIAAIKDITTLVPDGPSITDKKARLWAFNFVPDTSLGTFASLKLKTSTSETLSGLSSKYFIFKEEPERTSYLLKSGESRGQKLIVVPSAEEDSIKREIAFCVKSTKYGQICQTKQIGVSSSGTADTAPPTIVAVKTDPPKAAPISLVSIVATVDDNGPMSKVVFLVDGDGDGSLDTTKTTTTSIDGEIRSELISFAKSGAYKYEVRAYDKSNNPSAVFSGTITIEDAVDLVVTSISVEPRKITSTDQKVKVDVAIHNKGNIEAKKTNIRLRIGGKLLVGSMGPDQNIPPFYQPQVAQEVGKFTAELALGDAFKPLDGTFTRMSAEAYVNIGEAGDEKKPTEVNEKDNTKESENLQIGEKATQPTPTPTPETDFTIKNFVSDKTKITGSDNVIFSFEIPETTTGVTISVRCNLPEKSTDLIELSQDNAFSTSLARATPQKFSWTFPDDFGTKDSSGNRVGLSLAKGSYSCKVYGKLGDKQKFSDTITITSEVERKTTTTPPESGISPKPPTQAIEENCAKHKYCITCTEKASESCGWDTSAGESSAKCRLGKKDGSSDQKVTTKDKNWIWYRSEKERGKSAEPLTCDSISGPKASDVPIGVTDDEIDKAPDKTDLCSQFSACGECALPAKYGCGWDVTASYDKGVCKNGNKDGAQKTNAKTADKTWMWYPSEGERGKYPEPLSCSYIQCKTYKTCETCTSTAKDSCGWDISAGKDKGTCETGSSKGSPYGNAKTESKNWIWYPSKESRGSVTEALDCSFLSSTG